MTDLGLRDILAHMWWAPVLDWLWMPVVALFGLWILRRILEFLDDLWQEWREKGRAKRRKK